MVFYMEHAQAHSNAGKGLKFAQLGDHIDRSCFLGSIDKPFVLNIRHSHNRILQSFAAIHFNFLQQPSISIGTFALIFFTKIGIGKFAKRKFLRRRDFSTERDFSFDRSAGLGHHRSGQQHGAHNQGHSKRLTIPHNASS